LKPKERFKRYNRVFTEAIHLSYHAHTLHPKRERASSDDLHLRVPVGNPPLIGMDLPLITLIGVAERRSNILTCTKIKTTRAKA
jgi:hypothetical protein